MEDANMNNATPRPWTIWSDADGNPISQIYTESGKCVCVMAEDDTEKSIADAEMIVRAVNSHEALLEACQYARKFYQENFESMPVAFQTVDNILESAINQASK